MMPFISRAIEQELSDAIAETTAPRLLVAHDPATLTAAAVWVTVGLDGAPMMGRWAMSGPMEARHLDTWTAEVVRALGVVANAQPVTIN